MRRSAGLLPLIAALLGCPAPLRPGGSFTTQGAGPPGASDRGCLPGPGPAVTPSSARAAPLPALQIVFPAGSSGRGLVLYADDRVELSWQNDTVPSAHRLTAPRRAAFVRALLDTGACSHPAPGGERSLAIRSTLPGIERCDVDLDDWPADPERHRRFDAVLRLVEGLERELCGGARPPEPKVD